MLGRRLSFSMQTQQKLIGKLLPRSPAGYTKFTMRSAKGLGASGDLPIRVIIEWELSDDLISLSHEKFGLL